MLYCWNCRLICLKIKIFFKIFIIIVTKFYVVVNKVLYDGNMYSKDYICF